MAKKEDKNLESNQKSTDADKMMRMFETMLRSNDSKNFKVVYGNEPEMVEEDFEDENLTETEQEVYQTGFRDGILFACEHMTYLIQQMVSEEYEDEYEEDFDE